MKEYLPLLRRCPLFERIDDEGLLKTLNCLNVQAISCEKGKVIFHQGDAPQHFGVVLSGSVHVIMSDTHGNHSVMWTIGQSELFGETYSSAGAEAFPCSFVAAEDCQVLILDHMRVITGCRNNGCLAHSCMVTNLIKSIGRKNLLLTEKISVISNRTTRSKLMAYLRERQREAGAPRFIIPYDRQMLADYLCVERSAMSAELSRMKKDGLIDFNRNEFIMLEPAQQQKPQNN